MARAAEISERYRRFVEIECKGYSDAYYRLASEVADDACPNSASCSGALDFGMAAERMLSSDWRKLPDEQACSVQDQPDSRRPNRQRHPREKRHHRDTEPNVAVRSLGVLSLEP